jgi:acyl-CoA synthetase (NDP forming)
VDITAALLTNSGLFGAILRILAGDAGIDVLFVTLPVAGIGYDVSAFAQAAADFIAQTGKPLVFCTPQPGVAREFREAGVPTFESQRDAVAALAQLANHSALMRQPSPRRVGSAGGPWLGPTRFLDEATSLAFVKAAGLPVIEHRACDSLDAALIAFRDLGSPVVMKACVAELPHKSDYGLVVLNVDSEAAVARGFDLLQGRLRELGFGDTRLTVASQARGLREFMLGAKRDPVFGPVVMIGDGGRYVEAFNDVTVLLAPVTAERVREALYTLRLAPLLDGFRGDPPFDLEALAAVAVGLGDLVAAPDASVKSIDLNPIVVRPRGQGVVIVDALVEQSTLAPGDAVKSR